MNIKLVILGYELGRIQVDLPVDAPYHTEPDKLGVNLPQQASSLIENLVDGVSGWWVDRMMKRWTR